jgi:hypothetical protein
MWKTRGGSSHGRNGGSESSESNESSGGSGGSGKSGTQSVNTTNTTNTTASSYEFKDDSGVKEEEEEEEGNTTQSEAVLTAQRLLRTINQPAATATATAATTSLPMGRSHFLVVKLTLYAANVHHNVHHNAHHNAHHREASPLWALAVMQAMREQSGHHHDDDGTYVRCVYGPSTSTSSSS